MILPFSTQINGKPTYFVEKIHKSFSLKQIYMIAGLDPSIHYPKDYNFYVKDKRPAKVHTIREDSKDRWKPGTMIDFFINCRQKDMFRFAPKLPVVSVQDIVIKRWGTKPKVYINDSFFPLPDKEVLNLAQNDGFDTVKDFFEYFNKDFTGKIRKQLFDHKDEFIEGKHFVKVCYIW